LAAVVTDDQLAKLAPFVGVESAEDVRAVADYRGEVEAVCPIHRDTRRSFGFNLRTGEWICRSYCGGGADIQDVIDMEFMWVPPDGRIAKKMVSRAEHLNGNHRLNLPKLATVKGWYNTLMDRDEQLEWLRQRRGINPWTAQRARIGYGEGVYKLPVFDEERRLVNVRSYDPAPKEDRRKIWSVKGCGSPPQLYPIGVLANAEPGDSVLFCEGEFDTLLALQSGVRAVTRTSAARSRWQPMWNDWLMDLHVYVCQDADRAGQAGNEIIAEGVAEVAASVHICHLPYEIKPAHGKDVSDFILEHGPTALGALMASAEREAT